MSPSSASDVAQHPGEHHPMHSPQPIPLEQTPDPDRIEERGLPDGTALRQLRSWQALTPCHLSAFRACFVSFSACFSRLGEIRSRRFGHLRNDVLILWVVIASKHCPYVQQFR